MKKTTILLGAGAMIPFGGPTTQELTERILLNNICGPVLSSIYKWTNKKVNFEFLLSSVENLLDWKLTSEDYNADSINSNLLVEPIYAYKYTPINTIWDIYREAVNEIIERVREYDLYTPFCLEKLRSLASFVINKSNTSNLKIYSLNYDRLIPKIVKNSNVSFYEGFKDQFCEYDITKFVNFHNTYFNLHGSIYYSFISGGRVKLEDIPMILDHRYNIEGGNPGEPKVFLPIIAGYSKSQRILSEPFNFGLATFMNDCNTCDRLVIAGYSFGDPHINSILKRFVKRESTEIQIIDYFEGDKIPDRIRAIPHLAFGILQARFIKDGDTYYIDKQPNIKTYFGGFEQYVNENL